MVERRGILVHPEELDEIWLNEIFERLIVFIDSLTA